jgi:hypothetical protein
MFGPRKTPRCSHSQITGLQGGVFIFFFLLFGLKAFAQNQPSGPPPQNRELIDQMGKERTQLSPQIYEYKEPVHGETDLKDILKNMHGSYYVSIMGPRLSGDSNETYNIYLPDAAPIQLFHAVSLSYQVNSDMEIGITDSGVQNLTDTTSEITGYSYSKSFTLYDPYLFVNLPNLVHVAGMSVYTSFALALIVTDASKSVGKITSLKLSQNWSINNFPSKWGLGFSIYLNPQFYSDPPPDGTTYRQTMAGNIAPYISYQVAPTFALLASTKFDFEHRSPSTGGFLAMEENLPDTTRFGCSITPNTFPLLLSIGGYFQFLTWNPSSDTSIFGADFSIGF